MSTAAPQLWCEMGPFAPQHGARVVAAGEVVDRAGETARPQLPHRADQRREHRAVAGEPPEQGHPPRGEGTAHERAGHVEVAGPAGRGPRRELTETHLHQDLGPHRVGDPPEADRARRSHPDRVPGSGDPADPARQGSRPHRPLHAEQGEPVVRHPEPFTDRAGDEQLAPRGDLVGHDRADRQAPPAVERHAVSGVQPPKPCARLAQHAEPTTQVSHHQVTPGAGHEHRIAPRVDGERLDRDVERPRRIVDHGTPRSDRSHHPERVTGHDDDVLDARDAVEVTLEATTGQPAGAPGEVRGREPHAATARRSEGGVGTPERRDDGRREHDGGHVERAATASMHRPTVPQRAGLQDDGLASRSISSTVRPSSSSMPRGACGFPSSASVIARWYHRAPSRQAVKRANTSSPTARRSASIARGCGACRRWSPGPPPATRSRPDRCTSAYAPTIQACRPPWAPRRRCTRARCRAPLRRTRRGSDRSAPRRRPRRHHGAARRRPRRRSRRLPSRARPRRGGARCRGRSFPCGSARRAHAARTRGPR